MKANMCCNWQWYLGHLYSCVVKNFFQSCTVNLEVIIFIIWNNVFLVFTVVGIRSFKFLGRVLIAFSKLEGFDLHKIVETSSSSSETWGLLVGTMGHFQATDIFGAKVEVSFRAKIRSPENVASSRLVAPGSPRMHLYVKGATCTCMSQHCCHLMRISWYRKTAQSLVNTLLSF